MKYCITIYTETTVAYNEHRSDYDSIEEVAKVANVLDKYMGQDILRAENNDQEYIDLEFIRGMVWCNKFDSQVYLDRYVVEKVYTLADDEMNRLKIVQHNYAIETALEQVTRE